LAISGALVSKVYSLALLCACCSAWMAMSANCAPSVMTASTLLFLVSSADIEDSTAALSVPLT
jgi:hypothetical protein